MKFILSLAALVLTFNISALEKVHNALAITTDKPFSTLGQIKAMFDGPLGKYMGCLLYTSPSPRDRH